MTGRSALKLASARIAVIREDLSGLAATGILLFVMDALRTMMRPGLFWGATGFLLCLAALGLARLISGLTGARTRTAPVNRWRVQPDARHFLDAFVYGDGIPALEAAALEKAAALYGPDADLEVARMGTIDTSPVSSKGSFCAHVLVSCLNVPEEDR